MPSHALKLNEKDNVATALVAINKGDSVCISCHDGREMIQAQEDIPFGFKVSVGQIGRGDEIIKYGEIIGRASKNIAPGECVHIHNVEGTRGRGDKAEEK